MDSHTIPRVQNGKVLTEQHLYKIAQIPLNHFRYQPQIYGVGFYKPIINKEKIVSNNFIIEKNFIILKNIYVISDDGDIFIIENKKIEIQLDQGNILSLSYIIPNDSNDHKSGYIENKPKIKFKWIKFQENQSNSKIKQICICSISKKNDQLQFENFFPLPTTIDSQHTLFKTFLQFCSDVEHFRKKLLLYKNINTPDRDDLLFKCNQICLLFPAQPSLYILQEIRLFLRSLVLYVQKLYVNLFSKDLKLSEEYYENLKSNSPTSVALSMISDLNITEIIYKMPAKHKKPFKQNIKCLRCLIKIESFSNTTDYIHYLEKISSILKDASFLDEAWYKMVRANPFIDHLPSWSSAMIDTEGEISVLKITINTKEKPGGKIQWINNKNEKVDLCDFHDFKYDEDKQQYEYINDYENFGKTIVLFTKKDILENMKFYYILK